MKDEEFRQFDMNDLRNLDDLFVTESITPGQKIRAYRDKCGVTQKELASVTGISEQNISSIENDRREIGVQTAEKIAAFFGIDPSFLLFPNGLKGVVKKYKKIHKNGGKMIEQKLKQTGS